MELEFFKYQATGNDFIIIKENPQIPGSLSSLAERLCDRHFGIGADGLIIISDHPGNDFRMVFLNPDGTQGSFCGNGGRCAVMFYDIMSEGNGDYRFLAIDGEHSGKVLERNGDEYNVEISIQDVCLSSMTQYGEGSYIDTGAPHLVVIIEDIESIDVPARARPLRYSKKFLPEGINVNFVEKKDPWLKIRTYEKGVENETLSCGTGVTASALVFATNETDKEQEVPVESRGGRLRVKYVRKNDRFADIRLTGPASSSFKGIINLK